MASSPREEERRVILCNSAEKLKRALEPNSRVAHLLVLDADSDSQEIRKYMLRLAGCEEIDKADAVKSFRPGFKTKYIEVISELNRRNHSFFWWALYFTRKESLYTDFSENIFYCCLVADLMRRNRSSDFVIVTSDPRLIGQITTEAVALGYGTVKALKGELKLRERVKSFVPLRMGYTFLKAFRLWALVRLLCRYRTNSQDRYIVIGSLLEKSCFAGNGIYKDTYFGELPEYMSRRGIPVLVFGGVLRDSWNVLNLLRKRRMAFPVIPWSYYSSFLGMLKAMWYTALCYIRPIRLKGSAVIDGIDFSYMVKAAIRRDFQTGHFFDSVWLYHSARGLAKQVKVAACAYPYENRCWETMLVAGLSSEDGPVTTIGYNHAAITPAHTNMVLGNREAEVIPLPDTIVTMGEATKQLLEESDNYPQGIFAVGCALRQGRTGDGIRVRRRDGKIARLLVVLATSFDEYVDALYFLDKGLEGVEAYQVGIRPHPVFPLDRIADRLAGLKLEYVLMEGSLDENLEWPDVVIYVSSTVGLTAVSKGIPALNLDLGEFMDYDPAPANCPLRWSVSDPHELVPTLQKIEAIADDKFEALQQQAQQFGSQYFSPVTDESLAAFTKLLVDGRSHERRGKTTQLKQAL